MFYWICFLKGRPINHQSIPFRFRNILFCFWWGNILFCLRGLECWMFSECVFLVHFLLQQNIYLQNTHVLASSLRVWGLLRGTFDHQRTFLRSHQDQRGRSGLRGKLPGRARSSTLRGIIRTLFQPSEKQKGAHEYAST